MQTIGDRIKELRKAITPKRNQEEFGQALGVSRAVVTSYEINKVEPPQSVIKLICVTFGVSRRWLETGDGEMFLPQQGEEDMLEELRRALRGKGEPVQTALLALSSMPESWWDALFARIEQMRK